MSFNPYWIKPTDKVLTAAEVRSLPDGTTVTIVSSDKYGEMCKGDYRVLMRNGKKVLYSMNPHFDEAIQIKDAPNRRYLLKVE